MERGLSMMILVVLTTPGAGESNTDPDPRCACKYKTGLPEEAWIGGKYENLAMISQYGVTCAPWDSIPNTPWYAGYCDTAAGRDYCTNDDSWCDDAWCYVDKSCPSWVASSVFADVPGAPADLGYSYNTCGAKNCYANTTALGCPDDPLGLCADPCACLYSNGGLPTAAWEGGQYKDLSMISQYGATCAPWDSIPSTPWYADSCNVTQGKNYCHRDDSWCAAAWCYVSDKCPTWTKTSVFADTAGWENLGYSYKSCGAPDCYTDVNASGCPYDWNGQCCQCKYATGLPQNFWQGGQYETLPLIATYGVQCAPWDSIPGTPWFSGYCDTAKGKDYCSEDDGWCNDPWCYVDKDTCGSWVTTSVFADVAGAPETLGYSYHVCGSPNCYTKMGEGCPYDPQQDCEGVATTCGDLKSAYRAGGCCGAPAKTIRFK